MASIGSTARAWITLLTRPSYLAGAVLLAHSLAKHRSKYPLIIAYTPSFPSNLLPALEQECALTNASLLLIEPLEPKIKVSLIAARFADTWTKLRVFQLFQYDRLVFLDADMLIFRNMDELLDVDLPKNWIAANHACVCNLDRDSWAPEDWRKENCAYTGLRPEDVAPVTSKRTHTLLNSGMFVFSPHEEQWDAMIEFLYTSTLISTFMFPDQDFLAEFFKGRWVSVGWKYNALKTMRYWHLEMWRDAEVKNVHYIVDKPWSKRVERDGTAGYLGRDGETHCWWWKEYEQWEQDRESRGEKKVLDVVKSEVAQKVADGEVAESLHGDWKANPSDQARVAA